MLSLSEIVRTQLIPWSRQNAGEHFIVARRKMRQADMPYGVKLVPHKNQPPRVVVKNKRGYGNVRNIIAEWPKAGLQELGKHLLICVLDGHIDYTLSNYKIQCGAGHFIFVPPGIPRPTGSSTYADLQKGTSCDIITFLLHPNALEFWTTHSQEKEKKQSDYHLVLHESTVYLFQTLMKEVTTLEKDALHIEESLLATFFTLLLREIDAGRFQSYHPSNLPQKEPKILPSQDFLLHLERYVQGNLRKRLTLDMVSTEMYYSIPQFTRVIRRKTGKSFKQYLAMKRLEEAKKLLRDSQWTITAVASFCGLQSDSYFRTFFKRYTGMTPTEYRRRESKKISK